MRGKAHGPSSGASCSLLTPTQHVQRVQNTTFLVRNETLPYLCPWWETRDAGEEKHTSRARLPPRAAERGASASQQVDDVGEEDEAHDGEKHQHQNVHHDGNTARDGRCRREEDTQQTAQGGDRPRSGSFGGRRRERESAGPSPMPPPPPAPPAPRQEAEEDEGFFYLVFGLSGRLSRQTPNQDNP